MRAIVIAVLCCATAIACSLILTSRPPRVPTTRAASGDDGAPWRVTTVNDVPFVINQRTGEMWKYYFVLGDKGERLRQGFEKIELPSK